MRLMDEIKGLRQAIRDERAAYLTLLKDAADALVKHHDPTDAAVIFRLGVYIAYLETDQITASDNRP